MDRPRHDLLRQVVRSPLPDFPDLELCDYLVQLAKTELIAFGAGMTNRISNDDSRLLLRACGVVCKRGGIDFPTLPFRDLNGFRDHWISEGMDRSYQKRRDYIRDLFQLVEDEISNRWTVTWEGHLIAPVSPHHRTGWDVIDTELSELRQRFKNARTEQDHCAVGAACVRILEHLGDAAFDPSVHLPKGSAPPPRSNTKDRFNAVIGHALPGPHHSPLRQLSRAVIDVAQTVKHSRTPSGTEASIAADSLIMLTNIPRRLAPPER